MAIVFLKLTGLNQGRKIAFSFLFPSSHIEGLENDCLE
jgi:hypothetical protein